MSGQIQGQHEMSTLIPGQETCSLLMDLFSQQDVPPVTNFASSVSAFEQILGTLEHFTIHYTKKTVVYGGYRCRYVDIRDWFGSTVLKLITFPKKSPKCGDYELDKLQKVFLDSSNRPVMQAAHFKNYWPTSEVVLYAGDDPLGFITDKSGTFSTQLSFTVNTKAKANVATVTEVPASEMEMEVKGYTGCFCSCYNCGTDKPGGIRFHSSQPGVNGNTRELLADMECLSKREYADMTSRNWSQNLASRDDELQHGIAQLHIWANVPTLFKMWILFVSASVFHTTFEKTRCFGCCLIRSQVRFCWCLSFVLCIILIFIIGGFYKLFDLLWSLE